MDCEGDEVVVLIELVMKLEMRVMKLTLVKTIVDAG